LRKACTEPREGGGERFRVVRQIPQTKRCKRARARHRDKVSIKTVKKTENREKVEKKRTQANLLVPLTQQSYGGGSKGGAGAT